MLVTFSSKAHADVTLFGDVAKKLLGIMGHSGTIPGAIRPEDIPPALEQLRLAVAEDPASDDGNAPDDDSDRNISLSRRAWPLIELLSAAHRENCIVMWDRHGG